MYDLLKERLDNPDENISHTKMPTWEEHLAFIGKQPYNEWYVIVNLESPQDCIGSIYISYKEEIGIHISQGHQGKGYGPIVLQTVIDSLPKRCYYANINPKITAQSNCLSGSVLSQYKLLINYSLYRKIRFSFFFVWSVI